MPPPSLPPPPDGGVADGSVGDLSGMDGTTDSVGGSTVRAEGVGKGTSTGGVGEGTTVDRGWNSEVKRGWAGSRELDGITASVRGRK